MIRSYIKCEFVYEDRISSASSYMKIVYIKCNACILREKSLYIYNKKTLTISHHGVLKILYLNIILLKKLYIKYSMLTLIRVSLFVKGNMVIRNRI